MLEPTNEQLKELHKDIMSGDVMTITTEHYKQQTKRINKLKAALRKIKEHEEYLGVTSVYYDVQVFITADEALKGK